MASSGIGVDDSVINAFNLIKKDKKAKYALFTISDDQTKIVVDKIADKDATYEQFVEDLKAGPKYAVFDYKYTTNLDQTNQRLFFITWCPEGTKIKMKMLMSSSKDALKNKLVGFQHELQATDADEISEESFEDKIKDSKKCK